MIKIRHYNNSDYEILSKWSDNRNMSGQIIECLIPRDTTFILEYNDKPVMSLGIYLTNCLSISYLNNFISDKDFGPKEIRHECSKNLMNHVFNFAKTLGYKNVLCFSIEDGIKKRYEEIGMIKTLDGLSSFVRVL